MQIKINESQYKLQVIAVPIGNINEIAPRAIDALEKCDIIFCEDTRVTTKLLTILNISKKQLVSFQKFNENERADLAIDKIYKYRCVLVSDAGYPCISDPGYALVNKCHSNKIAVEVINGPSSITHMLAACGININNFYFVGFLNANKTQRIKKLKTLKDINVPIIFFESVHRILNMLDDVKQILNNPDIIVGRELTKKNETLYFGKADEISQELTIRGEFVVIIHNNSNNIKEEISVEDIKKQLKKLLKEHKPKEACKILAKKLNNEYTASSLYNSFINLKESKK